MSARLVRAFVAFGVIGASLFFALTTPVKLGLDLRGGTQIVLETRDSPTVTANAASTDLALEVLRRRVDALGVAEPSIIRSGDRRIIVELPGVQDPREAASIIGRTATLTFHPVLGAGSSAAAPPGSSSPSPSADAAAGRLLDDEDGAPILIGAGALTGEGVKNAAAMVDQQGLGQWTVSIDFNGAGDDRWAKLTGDAACAPAGDPRRRVAIVLDDRVISSPQVNPDVACHVGIAGGSTQIVGKFTAEDAKDLAALVKGGALPVPVEVIEQRTVGPTLGKAAIDASATAAMIGIALTGLFILIVYRLIGALATIALVAYALLSYAALAALGATLTLPGLAGFVLAIGMAVDANVLVFERAREAYAAQTRKSLRAALTTGFQKAWSAIIDSNVTTLLAAGLLFLLASGPVRGFGVTLSIGVLASMVSALVITRVLAEWAVNRPAVMRRPALTGLRATGRVRDWLTRRNPDLMKRRATWLGISAAVALLALTGIVVRGLDLGVEFTGGRLVEYSSSAPLSIDDAREVVSDAGFPRAIVQTSGSDGSAENISVRTAEMTNDQEAAVRTALAKHGGEVSKVRDELIGPSLGDELRQKALLALGISLVAQLLYLAVRFRWTFGGAAVLAMLHDVVIVTGTFAWLGRPIDGVFLAALLTVIGYSVNDTVVVFDRVREMRSTDPKSPFARVANSAVIQTVPRTVNTGMGAVFILATLLFVGGDSLADFALALLLGVAVGTYSSVFTATPLAVVLDARTSPTPARSMAATARAGGAER